jgi:ApaG protein
MVSKISSGISIMVETLYQADYSNPINNEFMFAYRITIDNFNTFSVKLLSRHWYIFDSNGENREVEGEGVVGMQPVIGNNQHFEYTSGCNLRTEMGRMYGTYTMENLHTKTVFTVEIPSFELYVPSKLN